MSFRMEVPDGYDLLSSIHSWIYPDIQPVPEQTGDGFFGRAYHLENELVALIINQKAPGGALRVRYSESSKRRSDLKKLVERTLGLSINFSDALTLMSEDPAISHLVPRLSGIKPYMSPTPYEALIKTIIQQQVSYKAANVFTKRMVLGLSEPITFENQSWYYFPDATMLASIGQKNLREFGFGYKAEYIHGAANLVAEGSLDIDSLIGVSHERVLAELKPIKGIGDWTVNVLMIAGLGDFSVFPFSDLVIQRILGKLYNHGERMTTKQVREHATNWGNSGTKILYLLMSAEVLGLIEISPQKTHKRLLVKNQTENSGE